MIELFVPSMIGDHDPVGVFETHMLLHMPEWVPDLEQHFLANCGHWIQNEQAQHFALPSFAHYPHKQLRVTGGLTLSYKAVKHPYDLPLLKVTHCDRNEQFPASRFRIEGVRHCGSRLVANPA